MNEKNINIYLQCTYILLIVGILNLIASIILTLYFTKVFLIIVFIFIFYTVGVYVFLYKVLKKEKVKVNE